MTKIVSTVYQKVLVMSVKMDGCYWRASVMINVLRVHLRIKEGTNTASIASIHACNVLMSMNV